METVLIKMNDYAETARDVLTNEQLDSEFFNDPDYMLTSEKPQDLVLDISGNGQQGYLSI